jgi:hypothetical protein
MPSLTVRQEEDHVLLLLDGRLVARVPWGQAEDMWRAIRTQSQAAEEWAHASRIIHDQALLLRIGATIGLTRHPALQAEAAKEAVSNRALRRYLPGGVHSQAHVGIPSIQQRIPRSS